MDTPDPKKVALINKNTGGRISTFKLEGGGVPGEDQLLKNSFVTLKGDYIGDLRVGWWYYLNNMHVCDEYPMGVAEIREADKIKAYYGYSHRGGAYFTIGDRLFKEDYQPIAEDYEPWQWAGWEMDYNRDVVEAVKEEDDWWLADIKSDGVGRYIPFNLRGKKTIETLEDAKQAAINLSKYLG
jgi:hypothetical protein